MGRYTGIIERLEKADEPDRTIDWEIHVIDGLEGVGMYGKHPTYTLSLDDTVALCGWKLPEWDWGVGKHRHHFEASVWLFDVLTEYEADGETPSIALLIAMFKALEAQDG